MKKKILIAAVIALCLAILGTGTLAYFTDKAVAHNVITSGGVTIDLVEKRADGSSFPEAGISGVMPGSNESKIAYIENVGASDAWIRVKLEKEVIGADGNALPADVIRCQIQSGWTEKDGYYYYTSVLEPGDKTDPIIRSVEFDPAMGNAYQSSTVTVSIKAQAVQSANNGSSVLTAAGWPE